MSRVLAVRVAGRPPAGPDDDGDRTFRSSKAEAQNEHDRVLAEIRGDPGAEKAIQRIVQIKTGAKVEFPVLTDLYEHWERIPRRKDPNERYAKQCKSGLRDFAEFVRKTKPEAVQFVQVSPARLTFPSWPCSGKNSSRLRWCGRTGRNMCSRNRPRCTWRTRMAEVLKKIDVKRMEVMIGLFMEMGFTEDESSIRAALAYHGSLGDRAFFGPFPPMAKRMEWRHIALDLLTHRP